MTKRIVIVIAIAAHSVCAQSSTEQTMTRAMTRVASAPNDTSNLPIERIGPDDLIGISVYDSPELTRTVRVNPDGYLRLPMLKTRIRAAGLYPAELETAVAAELTKEQIMVDPIVTISVVEYRSRPISVVGAVKSPVTFQATGTVSLLEALARAGGLAENAGPDIVVSNIQAGHDGKPALPATRIPVRELIDRADPALNLSLRGGEEIRVPEAPRVYVVGNVKEPGAFTIRDATDTSVLRAISLAKGLAPFTGNMAYIYRGSEGRTEITVPLKKILDRKAADVALLPNDILYITDRSGRRGLAHAMEIFGGGLGGAIIYGATHP